MSDSSKNKISANQIWSIGLFVFPTMFFANFGELFTSDPKMEILYGGLFGGLGALIGAAAVYLTWGKSLKHRIIGGVLVLAVCIVPAIILNNKKKPIEISSIDYTTCPVCGYIGYKTSSSGCDNCGVSLTHDEIVRSRLADRDEFIKMEQIYYFIPDEGDSINLFGPEVSEDGFEKDPDWEPVVPIDTVRAHAKAYYEFSKAHPVKIKVVEE